MEPAPSPAGPSICRTTGVILLARCRPGLVSSSRPPATTPAARTQNPSAPVAPSLSESRNLAPAGRVASRCRNAASPECSPTQRATNAAASAPASSPAIASGPCLRTANRYPSTPDTTPPARHTRQNAASAAMKAPVSVLTRAAAPGEVITSHGRGATAAQASPASTPSATVPMATASAATTARTPPRNRQGRTASSRGAGSGKGIGTDMVGSSVRDTPKNRRGSRLVAVKQTLLRWCAIVYRSSDSGGRVGQDEGYHVIEAQDLTKRYGDKLAVDHLSFTVEPGRVTGFLGPNGAGKSTTRRLGLDLDRANTVAP